MQTNVLNYRIIIEPDTYSGTGKLCYLAYAPTLDVADNGKTIEEALQNIQEAIQCRIEALMADGESVPKQDNMAETIVVTSARVAIPKNYPLAFS